jgi:hypothetical protein
MFNLKHVTPDAPAVLRFSEPQDDKNRRTAKTADPFTGNDPDKNRRTARTASLPDELITAALSVCDLHHDDDARQRMLDDLIERSPEDHPALLEHFRKQVALPPIPAGCHRIRFDHFPLTTGKTITFDADVPADLTGGLLSSGYEATALSGPAYPWPCLRIRESPRHRRSLRPW